MTGHASREQDLPSPTTADVPVDPLAEVSQQWHSRGLAEPLAMSAATALIHAQQVVTTALDRVLKPLGLTFARFEVLMLLSFTRTGALPTTKIGERLLVHPTGVTRLVDKLEKAELVRREVHPHDRRSMLVAITPAGRALAERGTEVTAGIRFGANLGDDDLEQIVVLLDRLRAVPLSTDQD